MMIEMLERNMKAKHLIIELKAKLNDLESAREKLMQLQAKKIGAFHQIDTYYVVPKGRLKLREVEGKDDAELIYYERGDVATPRCSSVFLLRIPQHHTFKKIAMKILETKVVVDKVREIYNFQGTQIHLDKVQNLGFFIEFERVTSKNTEQQDMFEVENLVRKFNLDPEDLLAVSYSDWM